MAGRRRSSRASGPAFPLNNRNGASEKGKNEWGKIFSPKAQKWIRFFTQLFGSLDSSFPKLSSALRASVTITVSIAVFFLLFLRRGAISLLVLGSANVFLILWCTVFSVGIVSGWSFFLIGFVVAVLVAFFINLLLSLVILSLVCFLLACLYGSFWKTLIVVAIEGGLIYKNKYKLAIVIGHFYSIYSICSQGGLTFFFLSILLSFLSNDIFLSISSTDFSQQIGNKNRYPNASENWNAGSSFSPNKPTQPDGSANTFKKNAESFRTSTSNEENFQENTFTERVNSSHNASTSSHDEFPSTSSQSSQSSSSSSFPSSSSTSTPSASSKFDFDHQGQYSDHAGFQDISANLVASGLGILHEIYSIFEFFKPKPNASEPKSLNEDPKNIELDSNPEDVMKRILESDDHYSVLKLKQFCEVDQSQLKKEYRKMAIMVHPDKHQGSEFAGEAFKRLQNAYEVLTDNEKKKEYDESIQRNYYLNIIRTQLKNLLQTEEDFSPNSRLVGCYNCHKSHIWICIERKISESRWCGSCQAFHPSKEGDVWTEQIQEKKGLYLFTRPEPMHAYACTDRKVFRVTSWFACQKMRSVPNSHKPPLSLKTHRGGVSYISCDAIPNLDSLSDEDLVIALAQATTPDQNLDSVALFQNLAALGSKLKSGSEPKTGKPNNRKRTKGNKA